MFYINFKGSYGVETVDEFDTMKEAKKMLIEYNMSYGGICYISTRCTKEWRNRD